MKTVFLSILVIVYLAVPVLAGESRTEPERLEMTKRAISVALQSQNDGVRTSALHLIAKIKGAYPETDMTRFNRTLAHMAEKDSRIDIRANAHLVYIYINSLDLPHRVKVVDKEDPFVFFNALYSELNQHVIATIQ